MKNRYLKMCTILHLLTEVTNFDFKIRKENFKTTNKSTLNLSVAKTHSVHFSYLLESYAKLIEKDI